MSKNDVKRNYKPLAVILVLACAGLVTVGIITIDPYDLLYRLRYYDDKVTLLNTGDVHGHIVFDDDTGGYWSLEEVNLVMGLPAIQDFANRIRAKNRDSLFLDSGDLFHGTNEANIEQGKAVLDTVNAMNYDGMVPGNHDFNFGFDRLLAIRDSLECPMLSANVFNKDGTLVFQEYKFFALGKKRVAVFGLTTDQALTYTNDRNISGVYIEDPYTSAKRTLSRIRDKADLVVLISHLGDDVDKKLVKAVPGIDIVFAGHHHFLYKKPLQIGASYIMEAGSYATHLGVAAVYFKHNKPAHVSWKTYHTRDKNKVDPGVAAVAETYHKIALEQGKEVIGTAKEKLDGFRSHIRSRETNLGNMLCDAMREQGNADLALMNGGGVRESIKQGAVTVYDVGEVLPFLNSLVTIRLPGAVIYQAVERGLNEYPDGVMNGGFLHVSGISYLFDASRPAGKRLVTILKNNEALSRDSMYTVATNDYLYNGGDDYCELTQAELVSRGSLLKDVLVRYIKERQVVDPQLEKRIQVTGERYK